MPGKFVSLGGYNATLLPEVARAHCDISFRSPPLVARGPARTVPPQSAVFRFLHLLLFRGKSGGNRDVYQAAEAFPAVVLFDRLPTYFVHPKAVGAADLEDGCALRPLEAPDEPSVLEFLAREGARRQFAPVVRSLTDFYGLARQDCYWLEKDGTCLAFCALWNQSAYKQYVAVRYGGLLKPLSLLPALLGYPPLPRLRVPLDFPVLSFFYAAGNELLRYRGVLAQVAAKLRARCEMFAIGLADGDPREALFRGLL